MGQESVDSELNSFGIIIAFLLDRLDLVRVKSLDFILDLRECVDDCLQALGLIVVLQFNRLHLLRLQKFNLFTNFGLLWLLLGLGLSHLRLLLRLRSEIVRDHR